MLRKATTITIAYYAIANILSGCCNCSPAPNRTFRYTGLRLDSRAYHVDADCVVRSEVDTATDYGSRNYLLRATVGYEFIAANRIHLAGLMNTAYACKCEEQTNTAQKALTNLRVFSINTFDAAHPAGSDITSLFGSPKTVIASPAGLGPLQLYFGSVYRGTEPYAIYDLYLVQRPTAGGIQQFRVTVTLSDSSTYSELTPVVRF